jgi:integrase
VRNRHDTLDPSLDSHYRILYERQRLRGGAKSTRCQFVINIRHFGRFLGRSAVIEDLRDDVIADAMGYLIDQGLAPRTANKFRDNMLAIWRFLARKGILDRWPDVDPLPEPVRIPIAWTEEQLKRLWNAIQAQPGRIGGIPANLWWHGLHSLAWDTAERITATYTVPWRQVDLDGGWVVIRAEARKGTRGNRSDHLSKLHGDTVTALRLIHDDHRERVFPWPHNHTYLWHRYKTILKRAGLPHDRDHMFHCLRKSVASYFEACGGNATKLLGHSARRVTERYLDPRVVRGQHAADVLFRPNRQ